MKRRSLIALCLAVLLLVTGCSSGNGSSTSNAGSSGGSGGKTEIIKIVATDNQWDSQKLHNAIAELVIEHAFDGYEFDVSTASTAMNWQSLMAGDIDIDIESWTDNVATYPDDIAEGRVIDLGILMSDGKQGIYVPRYMIEGDPERGIEATAPDLRSVTDIKNYAALVPDPEDSSKGALYGSIPGWMADEILYNKYEFYGLNETFNYIRLGSEATLFASLASAYNLGEPWIGYCYEPTWIAGKLDLVLLEDAPFDPELYQLGQCAFPSMDLKIVSHPDFPEKAPEVAEFLGKYKTGSAFISKALAYVDETKASYEDTAIWLLKENDNVIDEWLPAENAAKLREYLASM